MAIAGLSVAKNHYNTNKQFEKNRSQKFLDLSFLASISIFSTIVLVRDAAVRLCQVLVDESLVAHSHFFRHPEHFKLDAEFQAWSPIALSSMLNWLPASFSQLTHCPPIFLYIAAVLLQNLGIVCATYMLSSEISREWSSSRSLSILTAIFVMVWRPQWFNAALMTGLDWMPYSNWSSLPFLLLAFYFALKESWFKTWVCIIIGTLIHPILGGLAAVPISLFTVVTAKKEKKLRTAVNCLLLLLLTVATVLIPITISTAGMEFIADPNRQSILDKNIHATPWANHYPYGIGSFISALSYNFLFSLLAILPCAGKVKNSREQRLLLCTIATTYSATLLHIVSAATGQTSVQNFIASRSTILLLVVAAPYMLWQLLQLLLKGRTVAALAILTFLNYVNPVTLLASTIVALATQFENKNRAKCWAYILYLGSIAITATFLIGLIPAQAYTMQQTVYKPLLGDFYAQLLAQNRMLFFDWRIFTGTLIAFAILRLLNYSGKLSSVRMEWLLCLLLTGTLSFSCIAENRKLGKSEIVTTTPYYKAQLWVRDHTPPGSSFILVNTTNAMSWRGLTERQIVTINPIGQVYKSSRIATEYNARLKSFWEMHGRHLSCAGQDNVDLSTLDWLLFAKTFGGDYIVRRTDWPKLQLPVVYQNKEFMIMKLQTSTP